MSRQIRVTLHHDGSILKQLALPPPTSLSIINSIIKSSTSNASTSGNSNSTNKKQELEDFLYDIWNSFGIVTEVIYNKSYTYGIITYKNHLTAVYAFAAMNDTIQVQVVIQSCIGKDIQRASYAKLLFIESSNDNNIVSSSSGTTTTNVNHHGHVCTPSWVE